MNRDRFQAMTRRYDALRIAIVGDFCLDRYFEIDPSLSEESIETGLEVYNVTRVRTQPGAAGTILNNLVALGVGEIIPIGFCGEDAEGWLLERALRARERVSLRAFMRTEHRSTFTYTKPLLMRPGCTPRELNRLDQKNWTETPAVVSTELVQLLRDVAGEVDALVVMNQVDRPGTGTITRPVLDCLGELATSNPRLPILADSRHGLAEFPGLSFKMNAEEFRRMVDGGQSLSFDEMRAQVGVIAERNHRPAFVTLAERGMIGAEPGARVEHVASHPVRGELDIVGAGDSVTANLAAALAAEATVTEAMELAMAAASIVVHQLGTTGTASVKQIAAQLFESEG